MVIVYIQRTLCSCTVIICYLEYMPILTVCVCTTFVSLVFTREMMAGRGVFFLVHLFLSRKSV